MSNGTETKMISSSLPSASNGSGNRIIYYPTTISWSLTTSEEKKGLEPEKIIFNDRTTIVYWNDGTKTISTASIHDEYDPEIGFANCLMKKMYGKKVYGKKLYRRMIAKAQVQGYEAERNFQYWVEDKYNK